MANELSKVKRTGKLKWLIWGVLLILLLLIGLKVWRVGRIAFSLQNDWTQAQAMAADPGKADLTQLQPLVHQTHQDLAALQSELRPFEGLMRSLGWLPRIGGDVAAGPSLLALAVSMSEVGDITVTAMEPLLPLVADRENLNGGSEAILAAAAETLAGAGDDFERAQQSFERAVAHRAEIEVEQLSPPLARQVARLDKGLPLLELALQMAPLASDLLGANEPRTYLIIAQNNDELRGTGGFISSIGTLTLEGGKIAALTFEDSYAVDDLSRPYPDPPPQLQRYMLAGIWVFRDANWSPDFPTSAQAMLNLYHISRDTKVDGVIAVDLIALRYVVEALEPVKVPNWDEPATADNFIELIRQSWSPEGDFSGWDREWWENRKNFVNDLVGAIRDRVEKSPGNVDWVMFSQAILKTLDGRHVQIWLADESAQAFIQEQGWGGAIQDVSSDYLLVLDSNVGFNKVNAVTETSLVYEVDLRQVEQPAATLTVIHRNNNQSTKACDHKPRYGPDYWDLIDRCFWNYLRIYAPKNSVLLNATPHAVDGEFLFKQREEPARVVTLPSEAGKTVWGTLLLVSRGETVETTFQYTLPSGVVERTEAGWRYHLTWQKQAGTEGNKAKVVLQLPPDSQVVQTTSSPERVTEEGWLVFNLTLNTDKEIEVVFE